jgi:hypothetical protein
MNNVLDRPAPPPDLTVPYGPRPEHVVDLRLPARLPAPPQGADLSQVTWAGHSAGGHLVLWAAARPGLPQASGWQGPCTATHVVSLAGCNSLRLCAEWNLGAGAAAI